jgi:hypothetical protein
VPRNAGGSRPHRLDSKFAFRVREQSPGADRWDEGPFLQWDILPQVLRRNRSVVDGLNGVLVGAILFFKYLGQLGGFVRE